MQAYRTSRRALRRFLLDTQHLLDQSPIPHREYRDKSSSTPEQNLMHLIQQLECIQIDPVSAVEKNQHLVMAARLSNYRPSQLNQLLEEGKLFEYFANAACMIPMEDYPLFEPTRQRIRRQLQAELEKMEPVILHVLARLEKEGPLPARSFQSTQRVHGYWDNKQAKTKATSHALNLLLDIGKIRVVNREGNERYFDLTCRTVPAELLRQAETIDLREANGALLEKYLRAYRVVDPSDFRFGWQKMTAAERKAEMQKRVEEGTAIQLELDGVRRLYYILAADLERLREIESTMDDEPKSYEGTVRFLPPLDNLLWRRERLEDLFNFSYKWEIYTPQEKREYGYYAMPILAGDQLIGRIDPRLDRENHTLHVRLLQIEPQIKVTAKLRKSIQKALHTFASFHQAQDIVIEKTVPAELMK